MSARNTRAAKAARRKDRARRDREQANRTNWSDLGPLVDVHSFPELVDLAEHGATLPCGCDAHRLLHEMLGQA